MSSMLLIKVFLANLILIFGYCEQLEQNHINTINVCGRHRGSTLCCEGWTHSLDGACTTAICDGNCGDNGICIKPNQCRCEDRTIRFDCLEEDTNELLSDEPVRCPNGCNMQGSCIGGRCVCDYGYVGDACENEIVGPCFINIERGVCQNSLIRAGNQSTNITKSVCCGAFGAAWGPTCKVCGRSRCGQGYTLKDNTCVDINECLIPGVCMSGQCQNTEGSFICSCPFRYVYDASQAQCKPMQNICERQKDACRPGGVCVPLESGFYKCACDRGYTTTKTEKACVRQVQPLNYCEIYKNKICRNGICLPHANGYQCQCNSGYFQSNDKRQCLKSYDVCSLFGGQLCKNGQCVSMGRQFKCQCDRGYRLSQDGYFCMDKCQQLGDSVCNNGICIPKPYGGFECQCYAGFSPSFDRKYCERSNRRYDELQRIPSNSYKSSYNVKTRN